MLNSKILQCKFDMVYFKCAFCVNCTANPSIRTALNHSPDLESVGARVTNLVQLHKTLKDDENVVAAVDSSSNPSDSDVLLKDCALHLYKRVDQILLEYSDADLFGFDELGYVYNAHYDDDDDDFVFRVMLGGSRVVTYVEDLKRLGSELEGLQHSLASAASQGLDEATGSINSHTQIIDHLNVETAKLDDKFQILKLNDQIEKKTATLNSLSDLDCIYKRFQATEDVEDSMTGIKVLGFDKGFIRVALTTNIPNLESLSRQHKLKDIMEPNELSHELIIHVMDGSLELKNAEIFPNDACISEIIDATKSLSQSRSQLSTLETRSSLEWFVRKVQDKIILCTLRKYIIKNLANSRHSFEYTDIDEMIVARMVGGVSAFIKVYQGWPISNSPLKLVSLKTSDLHSKGMSLSFLCKVEQVSNAFDISIRQNIASFVDAIEETLVQQMSLELQSSRKQPRLS